MKTIIDTMCIIAKDMPKINDTLTLEWIGVNASLESKVKVNIHARYGEHNVNSLKKHIELTREEVGNSIIGNGEIRMQRIDIAIDTNKYTFNMDFKKLLFFGELLSIRAGGKSGGTNRFYTTDIDSLLPNSIKFKHKRDLTIEIYNKKLESPTHPYETRIEFRFDRKDRELGDCLDLFKYVIDMLNGLEGNLQRVEESMVERLINLWEKEAEKKLVTSFSEFVRKYNNYFYTLDILKGVYRQTGLKGAYSKWLEKFRKTNNIGFVTKKDIREFKKVAIDSVKAYLK